MAVVILAAWRPLTPAFVALGALRLLLHRWRHQADVCVLLDYLSVTPVLARAGADTLDIQASVLDLAEEVDPGEVDSFVLAAGLQNDDCHDQYLSGGELTVMLL